MIVHGGFFWERHDKCIAGACDGDLVTHCIFMERPRHWWRWYRAFTYVARMPKHENP